MKAQTIVRFGTYTMIGLSAILCYPRHTRHARPVHLVQSDESYFGWDGPTRDSATLAKASDITEIALHTVAPGVGIEPLFLRLNRDGHAWRRIEALSDYRLTVRENALRTVEESKSTCYDFDNLAYLIGGLDCRPTPNPLVCGWLESRIEVIFKDGTKRVYCYQKPPPDLWAIMQVMLQLNQSCEWSVIESKTERNRG